MLKKSFLIVLCSLLSAVAFSQSFSVDNLKYKILSEENLTCEIVGGSFDTNVGRFPSEVEYESKIYKVKGVGQYAFDGRSVTKVIIPDGVEYIGAYAFHGCSRLTTVDIPNSVVEIGEGAFSFCTYLHSITLPANLTVLRKYIFLLCNNLPSITIPEKVDSIEEQAFAGCSSLFEVTNLSKTPQPIVKDVFSVFDKLYVHPESVQLYKVADYWKDFDIDAFTIEGGNTVEHDTVYVEKTIVVHDTVFVNTTDTIYIYDDTRNSIVDTDGNSMSFYVRDGVLYIENAPLSSYIEVYSEDGSLVSKLYVSQETTALALPRKNLYIIRTHGKSFKLFL